MSHLIKEFMSRNLRVPQRGLGAIVVRQFLKSRSDYLEVIATKACNIQPDDKVLEIGFGPGVGLESAYSFVKDGNGKIYGIDISDAMVDMASKRMWRQIQDRKVEIQKDNVIDIRYKVQMFDRVFHCNCFYFWDDQVTCAKEILRVMKPGGLMVSSMNRDTLDVSTGKGYMKYANIDWHRYMRALEVAGFINIKIDHLTDTGITGKPYQLITAIAGEQ